MDTQVRTHRRARCRQAVSTPSEPISGLVTFDCELPYEHPMTEQLQKLVNDWPTQTGGIACGNVRPHRYSFRAQEESLRKMVAYMQKLAQRYRRANALRFD